MNPCRARIWTLFLLLVAGCAARNPRLPDSTASSPVAPSLLVGAAHVDMTPEGPIPLAGYGARYPNLSSGVHDQVFARAVVVASGQTRLALVSCDFRGASRALLEDVGQAVQSSGSGIPPENILLAGTHTHAGPGGYVDHPLWKLIVGNYRQDIYDKLRESIVQSILEAEKHLKPATFSSGSVRLEGVVRNRRDETLTDPVMNVMRFDGKNNRPIAILVNFACHPTLVDEEDMLLGREFPGALVDEVMGRYSNKAECLFFNGAEGDQSPNVEGVPDQNRYDRATAFGRQLALQAIALSDQLKPGPAPQVSVVCRRIPLPPNVFSPSSLLPAEATFHRIQIGDAWLMTVPGESVCENGLLIKMMARQAGAKLPIVIGLADDHLGYLVTPEQYAKGGYEASMCFYGPNVCHALIQGSLGDLYPEGGLAPEPELLAGGELIKGEGPFLLKVKGSPFAMGFQHGSLLKEEIASFMADWAPALAQALTPAYEALKKEQPLVAIFVNGLGGFDSVALPVLGLVSRKVLPNTDPAFYEELRGIAAGSGQPFDRILALNAWVALAVQEDLLDLADAFNFCTNVVRIPPNRKAPLIHARTVDWDWAPMLRSRTLVMEAHPDSGHAFLSVTWPGIAAVLTALNDQGLSVASETVSSQSEPSMEHTPHMFTLRKLIQEDRTLDEAVRRLQASLGEAGFHITLADAKARDAASVDLCPTLSNVRKPLSGWLLGCIVEDMPEPYVGPSFKGPGLTTIDQGEREKYTYIQEVTRQKSVRLDTVEDWENFLLHSVIVDEGTLHTTVLVPGQGELFLHRIAADGETTYHRYALAP